MKHRLWLGAAALAATTAFASHDDELGARYVEMSGANATDCLDHDVPCRSIQYALAQAEPGNTVKVAAGIYDMSGVEPETFLFGTIKAAGGYTPADHFAWSDPDANPTILVGVDPRYRQAMGRMGFQWAADLASAQMGIVDKSPAQALQSTQFVPATCVQGFAGQFPCHNIDFQAQIALNQFSTLPASAANLWGFVDLNDNREYAVIGLRNGTAVVEVTNPASPREVATIAGNTSSWREVKIYQQFDTPTNQYRAYAYISTEAPGSGIQVIDLTGLPNSVALATTVTDTSSQHTLYVSNIDYSTNVALPGQQPFLFVAGSRPGNGNWRAYSLANPASPVFVSSVPTAQYMHDSTSLHITDNRAMQCAQAHNPCEVLVDFNENSVDLWDVTDKALPALLSSTSYPTVQYTHSGWPSADQRSLFIHDELEEIRSGLNTQIYTMRLDDLRTPSIVTSYIGPNTTTDHNGYTKGNYYYVSHYRRGVVIFDATTPNQLVEIANFDTFLAPAADSAGTDGAWGVYPFLPSGTIVVSDITNGLFVLEDNTPTLGQSAGRLGFAAPVVGASEAGTATVLVQRSGGFAGAVSIQYATSDGTATAGVDYTAASGTLNWANGDLSDKTFMIAFANDANVEPDETLIVTLSSIAGGATLDGATQLTVTIVNDDAAAPSGGGGGGAMSLLFVAILALLLCGSGFSRDVSSG
ncbi:MAG TPA: choice-of-anchor B family protein [Gammaproteobacteria bacterium]|jgi:choice-of-anchor B domain-containing protein